MPFFTDTLSMDSQDHLDTENRGEKFPKWAAKWRSDVAAAADFHRSSSRGSRRGLVQVSFVKHKSYAKTEVRDARSKFN